MNSNLAVVIIFVSFFLFLGTITISDSFHQVTPAEASLKCIKLIPGIPSPEMIKACALISNQDLHQ